MEGAPPNPLRELTPPLISSPLPHRADYPLCRSPKNRKIKTGAWISIQPTLVNGMSLLNDEWKDTMKRKYGLELIDLPKCYDSYGAKFTIKYALACKKGGLVLGHHNEVKAETGGISIQLLVNNRVWDKPKIITCCDTPDT